MSMLQAQCDELRSMAGSVGLAVPQAATLMMGAADTIEGFDAENAKMREFVADSLLTMREYAAKYGIEPTSNSRKMHESDRAQGLGIEVDR